MITVISGTNRKKSKTSNVSDYIVDRLKSGNVDVQKLDLINVASKISFDDMYLGTEMNSDLVEVQEQLIIKASKLIVVAPEYNGSFPGVLKTFIDAMSVRKYKENFYGKKIGLVGVASGRAGNLRGMEHLTGIFNYLGATIMPNRLPISQIETYYDNEVMQVDKLEALDQFINEFVRF